MNSSADPSTSLFSNPNNKLHRHGSPSSTKKEDELPATATALPSTPRSRMFYSYSTNEVQEYFYSKASSIRQRRLTTKDLPHEPGAIGMYSKWAVLWGCLSAIVPVAYSYIVFVLLRECNSSIPRLASFLQHYLPPLATWLDQMQQQRRSTTTATSGLSNLAHALLEAWCVLEALFYVALNLHKRYLDSRDPLEQCLSSAPLMKLSERALLWKRIMDIERNDPDGWITGWFFDQDIDKISRYDVREFITWCMFEGRNQEHLTGDELAQLHLFLHQLELSISLHWYGEETEEEEEEEKDKHINDNHEKVEDDIRRTASNIYSSDTNEDCCEDDHPVPKKWFRFNDLETAASPNFFFQLYDSYQQSYEKYRSIMAERTNDFRPVEDFWNFMAAATQQILEAEEQARETATNRAAQMYETILQPVGDTLAQQPGYSQLSAMGQVTRRQFVHAFHSVQQGVQGMRDRLETAKLLSTERKIIQQQLRGYREMLHRLREVSSDVPSNQMAVLMRRITEANQALEKLEHGARDAFVKATGYARKNLPFPIQPGDDQDPQPFARYSSDPLLGVATFPLGVHLLILGGTEIPLRIMMRNRGFQRKTIGSVAYYFHPGDATQYNNNNDTENDDTVKHIGRRRKDTADSDAIFDKFKESTKEKTPIVFVHGIGIGLITYISLVDSFLKLGRPFFLPEIPYVSGFRPWQGPNAVLPPAVVCSTMTAMLATHGYLRATFAGHSYGTSWLSYMCKYEAPAVSALLFLDPICFCLHVPRLTKQFVYHRPDPGAISYIVRSDLIVNWTIQRSFPWAWIILFPDQIHVPCTVFLSDKDALVPAEKVEQFLRSKGAPIEDFKPGMKMPNFERLPNSETDLYDDEPTSAKQMINGCIFRGHGHGDWTDYPEHTVPVIADSVRMLCEKAESSQGWV